jgi:putative transposase
MARPLRIEFPGAVYHITTRGNGREEIFFEDSDRLRFLEIFSGTIEKYNWLCHSYCLMDNHYHLVVETLDPNLSLGMRQLNGMYTQAFNRKHRRVGHVFQGRFKSILVEKDSYLLELCRYVVLNPVRANMVEEPSAWRWSSFKVTATGRQVPEFLTVDWVLGQFSEKKSKARAQYRAFVMEGLEEQSQSKPWQDLVGQIFLGSADFVERMQELIGEKEGIREIPRAQRYPGRPSLEKFFADAGKKEKSLRDDKIVLAHLTYGYTLKEIADHLGIHYATVSRIVSAKRKKLFFKT